MPTVGGLHLPYGEKPIDEKFVRQKAQSVGATRRMGSGVVGDPRRVRGNQNKGDRRAGKEDCECNTPHWAVVLPLVICVALLGTYFSGLFPRSQMVKVGDRVPEGPPPTPPCGIGILALIDDVQAATQGFEYLFSRGANACSPTGPIHTLSKDKKAMIDIILVGKRGVGTKVERLVRGIASKSPCLRLTRSTVHSVSGFGFAPSRTWCSTLLTSMRGAIAPDMVAATARSGLMVLDLSNVDPTGNGTARPEERVGAVPPEFWLDRLADQFLQHGACGGRTECDFLFKRQKNCQTAGQPLSSKVSGLYCPHSDLPIARVLAKPGSRTPLFCHNDLTDPFASQRAGNSTQHLFPYMEEDEGLISCLPPVEETQPASQPNRNRSIPLRLGASKRVFLRSVKRDPPKTQKPVCEKGPRHRSAEWGPYLYELLFSSSNGACVWEEMAQLGYLEAIFILLAWLFGVAFGLTFVGFSWLLFAKILCGLCQKVGCECCCDE